MYVTQLTLGEGDGTDYPFVYIDTGTDLTWVQCEGCNPCFPYQLKNYNYEKSTSFSRVSVDDQMCDPLLRIIDGSCAIYMSYGPSPPNGGVITGLLGRENVKFKNSETNNMDVYQGLAFGCALHNVNMKFADIGGSENLIAGMFGLSPTPRSFLFQLEPVTKGRFSYCLPPILPNVKPSESTIYFGDDAIITGDATRQVQTISMYSDRHYYLYLIGISVNGIRLQIDPSVFEIGQGHTRRGLIIDSGAPYTVLAKSAYDRLRDKISSFFKDAYDWSPTPPGEVLDLCYPSYPNYDQLVYPSVTLHFWSLEQVGMVDMVLNKEQLFVRLSLEGFCLMMGSVEDPGPSFLGAFQQTNFRFLYDVYNRCLSFVPDNCAEHVYV
ncbi:hypothetical protein RND81_11G103100 [Saponaria officinalis]|uniref:Peptidase A1 domain-containing protein n=1 Tax=Saponaria officinalis TaxID=3572 RepID=A0AAW1HJC5_SAPOF